MATVFQWATPQSLVTYASTSMNSMADGAFLAVANASTISNDTGLFQYIALEVKLGPLSPAAGAFVDIWLYPSLDNGVSFASPSLPLQASNLLATVQLDTSASTSQCLIVTNKTIPPCAFKLSFRNKSGVQTNGTGSSPNTFKYVLYNEQGV